jgi:steroid 5-alpha reductase family enzyme
MKFPSSPLVVYLIVYSSAILLGIILHLLLFPLISSAVYRFYVIDFYITCVLFLLGNYIFSSINIYDIHWPLIPLLSTIYFHITSDTIEILSPERLPLILIICFWSFHLIWQTISSTNNIQHEDWRYQLMRKEYKTNFSLFAFFALHLLPMCEVLLGSSSIYYIYINTHVDSVLDSLFLLFTFSGVLLEYIADKQLNDFRQFKKKSKENRFAVLSQGLWKYSRHPNYLGEMIFWWGLFGLGYVYHAPLWTILGPLLITLTMIFGSIPMSEERLFRKYPEYKFVQQRKSILIPTFGLTSFLY